MSQQKTIAITGLQEASAEVRAAVHKGVLSGLQAIGIEGVKDVTEEIRTPYDGMPPAVFKSNLANSIFFALTPGAMLSMLRIQAGAPSDVYAGPINEGARPHLPPVNALLPWVKQKFGVDDERSALSIAWAIAKNQEKKGLRGRQMFPRAEARVIPNSPSILLRQISEQLQVAGFGGAHASA